MSAKPSNPKDAVGVKKVPLMSVVPLGVVARLALGLLEGALKYGRHNYRSVGVRASVYVDATNRHLAQFWEGEDLDPESRAGLHHIDKAIASLVVLRDSMLQGNWTDDRPPVSPAGWMDEANTIARGLVEMFPNPVAAHMQSDRDRAMEEAIAAADAGDTLAQFAESEAPRPYVEPPFVLGVHGGEECLSEEEQRRRAIARGQWERTLISRMARESEAPEPNRQFEAPRRPFVDDVDPASRDEVPRQMTVAALEDAASAVNYARGGYVGLRRAVPEESYQSPDRSTGEFPRECDPLNPPRDLLPFRTTVLPPSAFTVPTESVRGPYG